MTERIDLDELATDDEPTADARPRGAWFWEGEGDPDEEVDPWSTTARPDDAATASIPGDDTAVGEDGDDTTVGEDGDDTAVGEDGDDTDHVSMPRVPRTNDDRPVGIPMEGGGSGGVAAGATPSETQTGAGSEPGAAPAEAGVGPSETTPPSTPDGTDATAAAAGPEQTEASGPHGGGADEMTLAFTYNAITRLSHLHGALADAEGWTDWIGVVGDVEAYVINKFQRDNHLDLDFFNGSGTSPAERLAAVDEHSMFYADRMVLVGVAGEDDHIAEDAGWEFVPLEDAAAKAGWELDG